MLKIEYKPELDVVEIEGVFYSGNFFRSLSLSGLTLNEPFEIVKRGEGRVDIHKIGPEVKALVEAAKDFLAWAGRGDHVHFVNRPMAEEDAKSRCQECRLVEALAPFQSPKTKDLETAKANENLGGENTK